MSDPDFPQELCALMRDNTPEEDAAELLLLAEPRSPIRRTDDLNELRSAVLMAI